MVVEVESLLVNVRIVPPVSVELVDMVDIVGSKGGGGR